MRHSLLLLLRGPMQSWGDASRFKDRQTASTPSKSGVLGLLAAAEGRRRCDSVEDLAQLRFAVRTDQPGSLLRDYQTAQEWQTTGDTSLVTRYYLADAVFVAAVESPDRKILEGLEQAMRSPRFPLYLGRRSCPAGPDLVIGIRDADAVAALREEPWHASSAHRRLRPREVVLPIHRDAVDDERGEQRRDVPISFDQRRREYSWRTVVTEPEGVRMKNPEGREVFDPFFDEVISA